MRSYKIQLGVASYYFLIIRENKLTKRNGGYDENIAQEIKDIKVQLVEQLTKERDEALEALRIVLLENTDLKNFLKEKELVDDNGQVIT